MSAIRNEKCVQNFWQKLFRMNDLLPCNHWWMISHQNHTRFHTLNMFGDLCNRMHVDNPFEINFICSKILWLDFIKSHWVDCIRNFIAMNNSVKLRNWCAATSGVNFKCDSLFLTFECWLLAVLPWCFFIGAFRLAAF